MEIPMLKMSQNSESASSPETKEEWHKEKKNSQRGVCMKITEADTITCDDLVHNCIINVGKLCTTTAKLENDHNYIFHRSSSRFKLIVHLQKTITDLPISCLKSITSSILDAIKDVDLLLIDLGKIEHHQDWIQTIGQDLRYKKRPAFGIIASSLIETGQKDAKYDMFKCFGHLIVTARGQKLTISSKERGHYWCNILISQADDNENSPVVTIEVPNGTAGHASRQTTDEMCLSFQEAIRSKYLRKKIFQAVEENSRLKESPLDQLLIRISLNVPNENLFKKPTVENEEDIYHVMRTAILEYNHKVLAGLYEMNVIRLDFGEALMKVIQEISKKDSELESNVKKKLKKFRDIKFDKPEIANDKKKGILMTFLHSLLEKQFKTSLFYWSHLDHLLANAVVAIHILKKMSKEERNRKIHKKIDKYITVYQNLANDALQSCTLESEEQTHKLLVAKIPYWDGESCLTLAKKTTNRIFLHQETCRTLNLKFWRGGALEEQKDNGRINKMLTPKVCFILDMIGYVLFLVSYGFLLVTQLTQSKFHFLEAVVIVYMVALFVREYDQCFCQGNRRNILTREYLLDPFNILDNIALFMNIMAWGLRLTAFVNGHRRWMYTARYFFSFDYIIYSIRFLEYFYINRSLGPILVTIAHLLKIYVPFMTVLLIFLLAYSVASESLLYPETPLNSGTLYYVFRKGFWAMIGEYNLEDLEALTDCTTDPLLYSNYTQRRCPAKYSRYMGYILVGLFSLFVQILLFNILIGLFSDAITRNYAEADLIGNYQRFHLSMEYSTTRYLLPPFLPLCFFLSKKIRDPYANDEHGDGESDGQDVIDFERLAAEKIINSILDQSILKGKTQKRLTARLKLMKGKYETRQKIRMSKIGQETSADVQRMSQGLPNADKLLVLTEDDLHLIAFKMAKILADNQPEEDDQ